MPELAAFQNDFADALRSHRPQGTFARAAGFAVYRNTCARGAIEALRATYSTVDSLLGEKAFTGIATRFYLGRPPDSPVLARYGSGFAEYLRRQPWHTQLPYLADVAWLDRLWMEAHFAAETPVLEEAPSCDAICDRPQMRLDPSTRFAWLDTPSMTIWLAHRSEGGFESLEPEWHGEGALFTRRAGMVRAQPIDRTDYLLLGQLAAGASIASAAQALMRRFPDADVTGAFAHLLAAGAIRTL